MTIAPKLGDRIRYLRKKKNRSQTDLANYLDKDTATISRWERNLFEPDLPTIKKIAAYFDVSPEYLMGLTDDSTCKISRLDLKKALMEKELTWGDQKLSKEDQETLRKIILAVLEREGLV